MRDADVNAVKEYSAEDADITWQLHEKFAPRLEEDGITKLFNEVEMPLVSVLADMETGGHPHRHSRLEDASARS